MSEIKKSWDQLWPHVIKAQDSLLSAYPEALPVLRSLVGQLTSQADPALADKPSGPPAAKRKKLKTLFSCFHPRTLLSFLPRKKVTQEKILYIPLFDRVYCLDACGLVMESVQKISPRSANMVVCPPLMSRGNCPIPDGVSWVTVESIAGTFPQFRILVRGFFAYFQFLKGAAKCDLHRRYLTDGFGNWRLSVLIKFLVHYRYVAAASTWLKREQISQLVTINDTVEAGAWLIAAANLQGKKSHLIMHGVSGPQSWPFIADDCWVWGRRSFENLTRFGAPRSRLRIVGHLESEIDLSRTMTKRSEDGALIQEKVGRSQTLLVFSQVCANHGWKTEVFSEVLTLGIMTVSRLGADWALRVRTHPSESPDFSSSLQETCREKGVRLEVTGENPLEDDLASADFALSVNSTALMTAVLSGLACAQYYPDQTRRQFGEPFLSEELVVDSVSGLLALVQLPSPRMKEIMNKNLTSLFSNRGRVADVAAEQLIVS